MSNRSGSRSIDIYAGISSIKESLRNTLGRFQMIGLIHTPNYENDAEIFPTYLVGSVIGGLQGQGGHVLVRDGRAVPPEALGRAKGEASLFGIHVAGAGT